MVGRGGNPEENEYYQGVFVGLWCVYMGRRLSAFYGLLLQGSGSGPGGFVNMVLASILLT